MHEIDLHGVRHQDVDMMVENFILTNQNSFPLTIICGNSVKMVQLVQAVINRIGCYNPHTLEKRYVVHGTDIPVGFIKGLPPTTGKKIHTPHGIFNSVAECMSNIKLTRYQILCNIKNKSNWFYIKD
jgi:hypothetical protein